MTKKEQQKAVIQQYKEERKQSVNEERKDQGRAGRFFKYLARKMCGRGDDIAEDDKKQRDNEKDYRRAISGPRRSTVLKNENLTGEEQIEKRRLNKVKQEREAELRNQKNQQISIQNQASK